MTPDAPVLLACEDVRPQLADSMLGTLPEQEMAAVRRHLRGCGGCRAEAAKLDQGISLFATAAHVADPPPQLEERVMSALSEEWSETPERRRARRLLAPRWLAVAAGVVAIAGALTWGGFSQVQANRSRSDAASYRHFLGALGGRNVRVAALKGSGGNAIDGSAILYDSDHGQSWLLVLAHAPGYTGDVDVTLSASNGARISLRPMHIDADGDASTWLVTSSDISRFATVTLR